MPSILMIQKKPVTIWGNDDFAVTLRETLGDDAERFFREALEAAEAKADDDPYRSCHGECDKVFETQEHYENVLHAVQDNLMTWPMLRETKQQLMQRRDYLLSMINHEL